MGADCLQLVSPFPALRKHQCWDRSCVSSWCESLNLHYSPSFSDLAQNLLRKAPVSGRAAQQRDAWHTVPTAPVTARVLHWQQRRLSPASWVQPPRRRQGMLSGPGLSGGRRVKRGGPWRRVPPPARGAGFGVERGGVPVRRIQTAGQVVGS